MNNSVVEIQRIFLSLLFAGFCILSVQAQTPINAKEFQSAFLARLILEKTDSVRKAHTVAGWQADRLLQKAALDHAIFLARENTLTHFQPTKAKHSPQDRVLYFGGKGYYAGENVAEHPIFVPLYKVSGQTVEKVATYEASALLFVEQWLSSAPHRKNLLSTAFEVSGVGVAFDKMEGRIYAVHLFSPKPQPEN